MIQLEKRTKQTASLQYLNATLLKVWLQVRFGRNIMSEKQLNLGLFIKLSKVSFIYTALLTIQNVSKQLYSDKQENNVSMTQTECNYAAK